MKKLNLIQRPSDQELIEQIGEVGDNRFGEYICMPQDALLEETKEDPDNPIIEVYNIAPERIEAAGKLGSFVISGLTTENQPAVVKVDPFSDSHRLGEVVIGRMTLSVKLRSLMKPKQKSTTDSS